MCTRAHDSAGKYKLEFRGTRYRDNAQTFPSDPVLGELKSETNLQMHKDTSSSTDFLVRYPIQFGILLAVVQVLHSLLPNLQCRVPVV